MTDERPTWTARHVPFPASAPTDPPAAPKSALRGRVVAMDDDDSVLDDGVVYLDGGMITAVRPAAESPPDGFEQLAALDTGGTIYPGLIELHNHLPYDVLQLWQVPKRYTNRDQWGGTPEYRRLISGPMTVLGRSPGLMAAVVRFVECKALLGGVTTTQGIELFSNHGARRFFRGLVRNVESAGDPALPDAATKVADVDATDAGRFLARLQKQSCFLLHLSEGTDARAREHFLALHFAPRRWAITRALAGIHCAALQPQDFKILARRHGAMVWSPLSNLLLYGQTADVVAAREAGVRVGIGSDWSPSGSKNLFGELKAAHLVAQFSADGPSPRDIVAMATRDAARILDWQDALGTLQEGRRADLILVGDKSGDPYEHLLHGDERAIRLVLVNGVARCGEPALMDALGARAETVAVGDQLRAVALAEASVDPEVEALTLAAAASRLQDALANLPQLAKKLEQAPPKLAAAPGEASEWFLALDELSDTGMDLRPHLPSPQSGRPTGPSPPLAAAEPLSHILGPLELDAITVAGDATLFDRLGAQPNLPPGFADGLRELYA